MRVPVFLATVAVALSGSSFAALAQDPGMMAAQQAQMATQQAMQNAQIANQQAMQTNQQAMQNAQQAGIFPYGPVLLRKPKFSLRAGIYNAPQQLRFTNIARGATVYYTTDGWTPTPASQQYDGPIAISATTHIQAIAISADGRSLVADAVYTLPAGAASEPVAAVATTQGVLRMGTEIALTFASAVDSQTARVGDKVPLKLAAPILLDGHPLSPDQATAQGTVIHVDHTAHAGQPGVLTVRVDLLHANGVTVPLHAVETLMGSNHYARTAGFAVIPLVGVASLLQHGEQAVIPVGMPIVASVAADTQLQPGS
jgi:hypothetical protein